MAVVSHGINEPLPRQMFQCGTYSLYQQPGSKYRDQHERGVPFLRATPVASFIEPTCANAVCLSVCDWTKIH